MTISHFLVYTGDAETGAAIRDWFAGAPAAMLIALPGVETVDLYAPESSDDPYLDPQPHGGGGPVLMAQTGYRDTDALEAGLASSAFRDLLDDPALIPGQTPGQSPGQGGGRGGGLSHDAMELQSFPVAGEEAPAALAAPVSYVVRYHRPAQDETHFVEHYCAVHPPVLGKFPRVRNVICYLPIAWTDPTNIANADYLLGNEVVFDSLEDLNAALASDVRHELREDYKSFPPFYGTNTHYAMRRQRLAG